MNRLIIVLALAVASALPAQTIETPIPFDSAHRFMTLTSASVERLRLGAPLWPVVGAYQDARLYSVAPGGGFMLVVQRPSGALERIPLGAVDREMLAGAIAAAMRAPDHPNADVGAELISEPAGNAFARHQTFLAAIAYGPLAASLVDDGAAAGGLYLLTTGMTFFVSYGSAQSNPFTRAQTSLAGTMGLAGGAGALLTGYALSDGADKGVRAAALAGAITGTIAGAALGQGMSDAEAHAVGLGIQTGAAAGAGLTGAVGADPRASALAATVVGAVGYPLGLAYQRHASYAITAGDVDAMSTSALVGTLAGGAFLGSNASTRATIALLGSGYVAGALLGDLAIARRFDLTQSQANVLSVGAVAGALLGAAIPVLAGSDELSPALGAGAAGAALGMAALAGTFHPAAPRLSNGSVAIPARRSGGFEFVPSGLAGLASRSPGKHVLARLTF